MHHPRMQRLPPGTRAALDEYRRWARDWHRGGPITIRYQRGHTAYSHIGHIMNAAAFLGQADSVGLRLLKASLTCCFPRLVIYEHKTAGSTDAFFSIGGTSFHMAASPRPADLRACCSLQSAWRSVYLLTVERALSSTRQMFQVLTASTQCNPLVIDSLESFVGAMVERSAAFDERLTEKTLRAIAHVCSALVVQAHANPSLRLRFVRGR